MILFRTAQGTDLEQIHALAQKSGVGITSLPKNLNTLKKRLERSIESNKKQIKEPQDEYYLFVLEDSLSQTILGVCGIVAHVGYTMPYYSFKLTKHTQVCHSLNIRNDYEILTLVNDNQGCTELSTLFLDPEHRKKNIGSLLSKARFLFMAQHPERFMERVVAELRGISNSQAQAPFWDSVSGHFFKMSFQQASELVLSTNKQFMEDLMPRNPIYIPLIPQQAKDVLGKPHPDSVLAQEILLKEGFRFNQCVHIFDAGPTVEAPMNQIRTLAQSQLKTLTDYCDQTEGVACFISNTSIPFRATTGKAVVFEQSCRLPQELAQLLHVQIGDSIRLTPR
jgi:arginine N-succinyltransferase